MRVEHMDRYVIVVECPNRADFNPRRLAMLPAVQRLLGHDVLMAGGTSPQGTIEMTCEEPVGSSAVLAELEAAAEAAGLPVVSGDIWVDVGDAISSTAIPCGEDDPC